LIILKNFFANLSIQGISLVIPVVTLPVIYRSLGMERFGEYVYVTTFSIIVSAFVEFSFNISGIYRISNSSPELAEEINNQILTTKLYLLFIVTISYFLFFFIYNIRFLDINFFLLFFASLMPSMIPNWAMQGNPINIKFSKLNILIRVLYGGLIIFFLPIFRNILSIAILSLITNLFSIAISYFLIFNELKWKFKISKIKIIIKRLKSDFPFFINGFTSGLVYSIIIFIISSKNMQMAASIGMADRILKVPLTIRNVIVHSMLPFLKKCIIFFGSFRLFIFYAIISYFIVSSLMSFLLVNSVNDIFKLLSINLPMDIRMVLSILLIKFIFGGVNMILVHWGFYYAKMEKSFTRPILILNIVFFFLGLLIYPFSSAQMALFVVVFAEIVLLTFLVLKLKLIF
jgi:PST family polysaccharide transporter